MKKLSEAFLKASHAGDTDGTVRAVLPIACQRLLNGGIDADDLIGLVAQVVAKQRPGVDGNWTDYCDALNAAYALGVGTGQQIRPGFFEKGGSR